jgi:hypothetical protein
MCYIEKLRILSRSVARSIFEVGFKMFPKCYNFGNELIFFIILIQGRVSNKLEFFFQEKGLFVGLQDFP